MSNWACGRTAAVLLIALFGVGASQAFAFGGGHSRGGFNNYHAQRMPGSSGRPNSFSRKNGFHSRSTYTESRNTRFPWRRPQVAETRVTRYPWWRRSKEAGSHATRYPWWRHPHGNKQASTSDGPSYPPRVPHPEGDGGKRYPHPPRDPGSDIWWKFRRPILPSPPIALVPTIPVPPAPVAVIGGIGAAATAIAGFGGSRPPIAPRFSQGQAREPSSAVAALLNNKRHRAKELLIEVATGSPFQLKQALANQYGVEVRELGSIELINARICCRILASSALSRITSTPPFKERAEVHPPHIAKRLCRHRPSRRFQRVAR